MRRLRPRLLAEHGQSGVLDDLHTKLAGAARLSAPVVESGGLTAYQLWMTPEQATILDAAIGPLSAPTPNEDTGERDLRPAGQRRVEALTALCTRSCALDATTGGGGGAAGAGGASSAVHVTIALNDLQTMTGCAEVMGSTATGTILSPVVLRRICCEADLIPHVLGTAGETLDQGRVVRLFTRARLTELHNIITGKLADEHPDTDHLEHQWATHQLTEHDDPSVPESWLDDASTPHIIEELERLTRAS